MKRVYRLLRNNEESGPFTIGELLGQKLRPTDMLWIEGRSTAWCYLSEIELFPSIEPEVSTKPAKPVKKDDIETRADEIRKKVLGFKPQQLPAREEKQVSRPEKRQVIPLIPLDSIEIVDHRRKRSSMPTDILMTLLIIGLFGGGLYGGRVLFLNKKELPSSVVQSVTKDEHAAKAVAPVIQQPVASISPVDTTALNLIKPKVATRNAVDPLRQSKRITKINTITEAAAVTEQTDTKPTANNETETKKDETELVKEVKPVSISNEEIAKDDTQEKKQNLFKKIFGKKKRNEN